MKDQISRRSFIKRAAAVTAVPLIVPNLSFAKAPSGRLQHAAIGVGGQGASDLGEIFGSGKVDVIALCDVDANTLNAAAQKYPGARLYRDWREMLEKEEKNIDSVNVATPDHTHAPATMTALRMGKHVYCEKPLTHEVYEARKVRLMAHKKKVATQMGIQIHAHDFYRTAVQWLTEGAIGKVKEWHSWSGAIFTMEDKKRPEGSDPIPPNLNWNLWLGTAPERPYKHETLVAGKMTPVYHPFWWRRFRDFGGGATGDFGCHIFDPVFTALHIGDPISLSCEAESVSDDVHPGWVITNYLFPGTPMTAGKTINATWRDGGKKPPVDLSPHLPKEAALDPSGSMLIGEEGTLIIPHVGKPRLYPEEKFKNYPVPKLEPKNHYHEFVEASLGNGTCGANFDFSGPMAEAVLLSNIANRFPGKTLEWDAKHLKFKNSKEANKYIRRKYRKGFSVRGL